MPPVQKAFQIASICCLISPVNMVGNEETFISGADVIVEQIGGVAEQRLAARRYAPGGGRVELLHVLFVCQLNGMGRLRGAVGLGRA